MIYLLRGHWRRESRVRVDDGLYQLRHAIRQVKHRWQSDLHSISREEKQIVAQPEMIAKRYELIILISHLIDGNICLC